MAKLTKAQAKAHDQACELLKKDWLNHDERLFVIDNWQESATHINSSAGAFFTPIELARHHAIELQQLSGRVIDLCAGIGSLSFALWEQSYYQRESLEIVCVEINPAYSEVGKKLLPEATWIVGDVFDVLDMGLGRFHAAISNPPFGAIKRSKNAPRYTGSAFEFHVIDIAAHMADFGVFILPQMSAGFEFSGKPCYRRQESGKAFDFQQKTGLHFEAGCGVDTAMFKDQWRGVSPICEIVCVDFDQDDVQEPAQPVAPAVERKAEPGQPSTGESQLSLFGDAA
jgi:predicted RNA methylase